jgi:hypothetical protein
MAACPVAFWVGDQVAAAHHTARLLDLSRQHVLPHWIAFGARFERALVVKAGGLRDGFPPRSGGQEERASPNFSFRSLAGLTQIVEALCEAGQIAEALALLLVGIEQFEAGCFTPELLRLKGELSLLQGQPDAAESAENLFRQSLARAHEHGTRSWELRAATSLARLLVRAGRPADAALFLRPVYDRFTESFGTADLIAARQLLGELGTPGHV